MFTFSGASNFVTLSTRDLSAHYAGSRLSLAILACTSCRACWPALYWVVSANSRLQELQSMLASLRGCLCQFSLARAAEHAGQPCTGLSLSILACKNCRACWPAFGVVSVNFRLHELHSLLASLVRGCLCQFSLTRVAEHAGQPCKGLSLSIFACTSCIACWPTIIISKSDVMDK